MSGARYRLPDHVIARRYVSAARNGSAEQSFIVLHDRGERGPRTLSIGEREWSFIEGMDGTRDLAGLVAAALERGAVLGHSHAAAFAEELAREGLVVDDAAPKSSLASDAKAASPESRDATSHEPVRTADRPLEELPGFALRCDGRGSCCRLYPSVLFSPLDAARARASLPLVRGAGEDELRAFLPERGVRREALAVTLVDGRCAYLGANGYCGIHEAAGAQAKPLGCRLFPAAYVDDGAAVRVTPAVECACVVRSAFDGDGGEPLVDASKTRGSDLDPRIYVDVLPETIRITGESSIDRGRYVAWSRSVEDVEVENLAAGFLALAGAIDSELPDTGAARALLATARANDIERLRPYLRALRLRAERRAEETWRSEVDLARQAFVAIASAAALAEDALETLMEPAPLMLAEERLYARVAFFGHHLVSRSLRVPLVLALYDRAVRVVVGRALAVVASMSSLSDPAFSAPLALVEAMLRGHGLAAYLLDVAAED